MLGSTWPCNLRDVWEAPRGPLTLRYRRADVGVTFLGQHGWINLDLCILSLVGVTWGLIELPIGRHVRRLSRMPVVGLTGCRWLPCLFSDAERLMSTGGSPGSQPNTTKRLCAISLCKCAIIPFFFFFCLILEFNLPPPSLEPSRIWRLISHADLPPHHDTSCIEGDLRNSAGGYLVQKKTRKKKRKSMW